MAEAGGGIKVAADPRKWAEIEKRIQEIRKQLRRRFGLSGDPLPYHSKSKNAAEFGYLARFKIGCGRSYDH